MNQQSPTPRVPTLAYSIKRVGVWIAILGVAWLGMLLCIFLLSAFGDPTPEQSPRLGAVAMVIALGTPCVAVTASLGAVAIRLVRRYHRP